MKHHNHPIAHFPSNPDLCFPRRYAPARSPRRILCFQPTQERPYVRAVGDEPLRGYRLVEPLGRGGFGEVWKCIAPGGLQKAVKFVFTDTPDDTRDGPGDQSLRQEHAAFERVKGIRHPFLLQLERVELIDGELIMVMELADRNLAQRFEECRTGGRPGIPRDELLAYMVDIAEALDVLGRQHGLQHLDVKPANLFLIGGHVKVGDYGLVVRTHKPNGEAEPRLSRGLTPKYVPPELLNDTVHARSDQYSLALVYYELLTGGFPYDGTNPRQLLMQHSAVVPDLSRLPVTDRIAVARGLSKNPDDRYPTCLDFVRALVRVADTPMPVRGLVTPRTRTSDSLTETKSLRMSTTRTTPASSELNIAFPGFRFVADVELTPRGRVIRAAGPDGKSYLIRLLHLDGGAAADFDAVLRAASESHPHLIQVVATPTPRLVAFARPEQMTTLRDLDRHRSAQGQPLKRAELLAFLRPAAAALDDLYQHHRFPHMLLTPADVIADTTATGVTGYGVGELLTRSRADLDWLDGHAYAAPESFAGRVGPQTDQFSLALIFLELAKAWTPPPHRPGVPRVPVPMFAVAALNDQEAGAVRRALSADPARRFESCSAFVAALSSSTAVTAKSITLTEVQLVETVARLSGQSDAILPHVMSLEPTAFIDALLKAAIPPPAPGTPKADARLTVHFPVRLTPELVKLKLAAFKDQWQYDLSKWTNDTYVLRPTSGTGAELTVQLPSNGHFTHGDLTLVARPVGPRSTVDTATTMLDRLRQQLQNVENRRNNPRLKTDLPVQVYPVTDDLEVSTPIAGRCKDLSLTGAAVLLTGPVPTGHVFVSFPTVRGTAGLALLARVVRLTDSAGHPLLAVRFVSAVS